MLTEQALIVPNGTPSAPVEPMALALRLAEAVGMASAPNPRVGCVLIDADGALIGQGNTQKVGSPHAEIMALRDAAKRGHSSRGATAYVTLEPCAHQGRTGPCCDALAAAGVKKVVASIQDPNPLVAGQGFAKLRTAGVEVEVGSGATASRELNLGFFSRMERQRPWVRMKIAASLDGKTALPNGQSQWITCDAARADGHTWRARANALLTGIGTVLADNPRLDARPAHVSPQSPPSPLIQPALIVVDSRLRTPIDAHLFIADRAVSIYAAEPNEAKQRALAARGAEVCIASLEGAIPSPRVDLLAMMKILAKQEINEVHVEAGAILNGALIQAGLVDELILYLAPKLLGQGRDMASFGSLINLSEAFELEFMSVTPVGSDLRILARRSTVEKFYTSSGLSFHRTVSH